MPSLRSLLAPRRTTPARRRSALAAPAVFVLAGVSAVAACDDIPVESETFPPQGNLRGVVTYSGPLPCVQRGHILGAANLLIFNRDLLPPPEGFGTTATQLAVVPGDVLFRAVSAQLPQNDTDAVVCPPADAPHVTVSADWIAGPLPAGRYQVRGFYDWNGDFSPILKLHQLPSRGDIGGGAIANVSEVLQGRPPEYQTFQLGVERDGKLVIPETGSEVNRISVTLGLELPFTRPIFHYESVADERPNSLEDGTTFPAPRTLNTDAQKVVMPQDERFLLAPPNHPAEAEAQFIRVRLGAGLPAANVLGVNEEAIGAQPPYFLQVGPDVSALWVFPNTDAEGNVKTIPEKAALPIAELFPQAIFSKLDERDPRLQTAQAGPAVIVQGLVMNDGSLIKTAVSNFLNPDKTVKPAKPVDGVTVALRPSTICLNPLDVNAPVYVVTPSFTALNGEQVIDPVDLVPKVVAQLGNRPNVKVIEGCLPKGKYAANLIYPTAQAWTVPNEGGVCMPLEEPEAGPGGFPFCHQGSFTPRAVLTSQSTVLEIGPEQEAGWCAATHFKGKDPQHPNDVEYIDGVPAVCLRADGR